MSTMYWIGVDHHKRNTYVTSLKDDGSVFCRRDLSARREALEDFFGNHPRPFVAGIEACYAWEYVADIVEGLGEEIRVGHPLLLKAFARRHKHNDKIDSRLSADLLYRGSFPAIAHPPKAARQRRDVYRQRMELVARRTSASARAKAFADRLGFHATMNLSRPPGVRTLAGLAVPTASGDVLESHVRGLAFLNEEIARVEAHIKCIAEHTPETQWVATVPGIGNYLALLITSEIFDIDRFASSKRLVGYAGLAPGSFSSGGKVFRGRLCPNANKSLRWAFVEAVIPYTRKDARAKAKYDRLKRSKGWKTARIAIGRHIARIVYHLLKERRPYRPPL